MAQILKQSTAVDVLIGPFVDILDGAAAEVGESPSVKLSKNGQTLAAKNDVTTPVSDADGYYNCELDATDTNTVGTMILTVAASATALPVRHEYQIVEEDAYEFLYATGSSPDADIAAIKTKTDFLPSATAGALGGVFIAGSNTGATSITTSGVAVSIVSTGADGDAISLNGNGTGAGLRTQGGATGVGIEALGGVTSGEGISASATTSGSGMTLSGVSNGNGLLIQGAGAGEGIRSIGGTSGSGIQADGQGVGHGIAATGGATSGDGIVATLGGSGVDIRGDITGNVTGNVSGSIGSLTGHTVQTGDTFALANGATGFVAIDTVVDGIQTDLSNGTDGLGAIKADTAATLADTGTTGVVIAAAQTVATVTDVTNLHASAATAAAQTTAQNDLDIVTGADGAVLLSGTQASVDAIEVDTGTTIPALLPAALVGGKIDANVGAISASTTAADNLEESTEAIIPGSSVTGTLSTTQSTSDLSGFLDDELIGRTIIWKSGTANGQASDITDYASASGLLTFTAITTLPANGDLFVVV